MITLFFFSRRLLENGSLYLESAAHSKFRPDDGVYQCVASIEGLGSIVSRKATLSLARKYFKFKWNAFQKFLAFPGSVLASCKLQY